MIDNDRVHFSDSGGNRNPPSTHHKQRLVGEYAIQRYNLGGMSSFDSLSIFFPVRLPAGTKGSDRCQGSTWYKFSASDKTSDS